MSHAADAQFMEESVRLALEGRGLTSPNPMVGSVVVADGEIVGRGWHSGPGTAHAETMALEEAGARAAGATIYVTLEPCDHFGRTPPCTESLIRSGVSRVVMGVIDPDPQVQGKGVEKLKGAGIEVTTGILDGEVAPLYTEYTVHRTMGRPHITLKLAVSLDFKVAAADGSSKWITSETSRTDAHLLRASADAIAVGRGTVETDDPALTVRHVESRRQPVRVVFDSHAATAETAQVLNGAAPTIILVTDRSPSLKTHALAAAGAQVIEVPESGGRIDLVKALLVLAEHGVVSLLLEGGPTLASSFVQAELVDRYVFYIAPIFLGDRATPALSGCSASTLEDGKHVLVTSVRQLGPDVRIEAEALR